MPWDGTELWQAQVEADGSLSGATFIAGGRMNRYSNRSGPLTAYSISFGSQWLVESLPAEAEVEVEAVTDLKLRWECLSGFLAYRYAFASPQQIVCVYQSAGWRVWQRSKLTR